MIVRDDTIEGIAAPDGSTLPFVAVEPEAQLAATLRAMRRTGASAALVFDDPGRPAPRSLKGVLTAQEIADSLHHDAELMA